jgi:hypothetical protein
LIPDSLRLGVSSECTHSRAVSLGFSEIGGLSVKPFQCYDTDMIHENLSQSIETLSARMIAIRDSL